MKKFGKFMTGRGVIFNDVPQNEEEALQHGNALAHGKNSNYPVGTSECFNVGISGGCGPDCFVYQKGECEVAGEMVEQLEPGGKYIDGEWGLKDHYELYPE